MQIALGDSVRIVKRDERISNKDIPIEYWAKGILVYNLQIGAPIVILRTKNARLKEDEQRLGIFISSPIRNIIKLSDHIKINTENSEYHLYKE